MNREKNDHLCAKDQTVKSGVIAVIISEDNKYLLIKQNKEPYKDFWGPVHGIIEHGETEENAVVRETKEEIGLTVTPTQKLGISNADYGAGELHWWLVAHEGGNIRIDTKEISEYGYFSSDELLNLKLFPMTRNFFLSNIQK